MVVLVVVANVEEEVAIIKHANPSKLADVDS